MLGDPTDLNSVAAKCKQHGGFDDARAYWTTVITEKVCDILGMYGADCIRNPREAENAACPSLLYEIGGGMPGFNWRTIPAEEILKRNSDESVRISDVQREGKKYLHRTFYHFIDIAMRYCGEVYGDEAVFQFFAEYVKTFYAPQIEKIKKDDLPKCTQQTSLRYTVIDQKAGFPLSLEYYIEDGAAKFNFQKSDNERNIPCQTQKQLSTQT